MRLDWHLANSCKFLIRDKISIAWLPVCNDLFLKSDFCKWVRLLTPLPPLSKPMADTAFDHFLPVAFWFYLFVILASKASLIFGDAYGLPLSFR
jgi:hypothetical protein